MSIGIPSASVSTSRQLPIPASSRRRMILPTVLTAAFFASALTVPAGPASAASPKLTITPSEIYYPCSEGNVTFAVKGFGADKRVKLHSGSASPDRKWRRLRRTRPERAARHRLQQCPPACTPTTQCRVKALVLAPLSRWVPVRSESRGVRELARGSAF